MKKIYLALIFILPLLLQAQINPVTKPTVFRNYVWFSDSVFAHEIKSDKVIFSDNTSITSVTGLIGPTGPTGACCNGSLLTFPLTSTDFTNCTSSGTWCTTITHNLNTLYPVTRLYDDTYKYYGSYKDSVIDANHIKLIIAKVAITGTWNYSVGTGGVQGVTGVTGATGATYINPININIGQSGTYSNIGNTNPSIVSEIFYTNILLDSIKCQNNTNLLTFESMSGTYMDSLKYVNDSLNTSLTYFGLNGNTDKLNYVSLYGNMNMLTVCCHDKANLKYFNIKNSGVQYAAIWGNDAITEYDFTGCTDLKKVYCSSVGDTSINFTGLANLEYIDASGSTLLDTVIITSMPKLLYGKFDGCALKQGAVDQLLSVCVANGLNGGTLKLDGGTSVTPGTQGQLDYTTLTTPPRNWTVTKN